MIFKLYSKGELCPFCIKAKDLIKERGDTNNEILIPNDISKEGMVRLVKQKTGLTVTTVPQVFANKDGEEVYIGGYTELLEFYNKQDAPSSEDFKDFDL